MSAALFIAKAVKNMFKGHILWLLEQFVLNSRKCWKNSPHYQPITHKNINTIYNNPKTKMSYLKFDKNLLINLDQSLPKGMLRTNRPAHITARPWWVATPASNTAC